MMAPTRQATVENCIVSELNFPGLSATSVILEVNRLIFGYVVGLVDRNLHQRR